MNDGLTKRPLLLLVALAVVTSTLFAAYSGVLSVLLPEKIAEIDPEGKVGALALVTSVSFAATALAQPLLGALSDATRSRWGRRLPWMVAGAVIGGTAVGLLGSATSVALLVVLWVVGQFALNGTDIASSAYLVDGFPVRRRGVVAGVLGISAIVGGAIGTVFAGLPELPPAQVSWLLAGLVGAGVLLFAVLVRDRSSSAAVRGGFWRGFLVSPRDHPDFYWVFAWRLAFTIALGAVYGFLLYIVTDHVGLSGSAATRLVVLATVVGAATMLVSAIAAGWLSDRWGRRKPFLVAAALLVAAADLLPILFPTAVGVIAVAAAIGVGMGISYSCGTALATLVLPEAERSAGRGLGLLNVATNVAQAIAPIAAAAVITLSGGYAALFVLSAAFMVASVVFVLGVRTAR